MQTRAEYQRARRAALSAPAAPESAPQPDATMMLDTAQEPASESPVKTGSIPALVSSPQAFDDVVAVVPTVTADSTSVNFAKNLLNFRAAKHARRLNPWRPAPVISVAAVATAVAVATGGGNAAGAAESEYQPEPAVIEAHLLTMDPIDEEIYMLRDVAASRASSRVDITEALGDQFEFLDPETLEAAADVLSNTELMLLRERGATPERIEEIQAAIDDLRTVLQTVVEVEPASEPAVAARALPEPEAAPLAAEAEAFGLPATDMWPTESVPEPELEPEETEIAPVDPNELVSSAIERVETLVSEVELPIPMMEPRALTVPEIIEALKVEAQADGARLHQEYAYTFAGYSNGRIPTDRLQNLSWAPNHMLRPDAATQLERLNEAFRAEFGHDMGVTSTYRSFAGQVQARARSGIWAATPGTSNHGWGIAVDFMGANNGIGRFGTAEHNWMREHAPAFGWIHPEWARRGGSLPEPWHWEFWGTPDPETGQPPTPGVIRGTERATPSN